MMALLKLVPMPVWFGLLIAALAGAGWFHVERITDQRDSAFEQLERSESQVSALESALEFRRENARKLERSLEQREKALENIQGEIRGYREALNRLEDRNEEVRDWGGDDLPGGISDWLRKLRDPGSTSANDSGDSLSLDRPSIGADAPSEKPPGSAGASR